MKADTPLGRDLLAAIKAADRAAVRDLLVAASEKDRRAAAGAPGWAFRANEREGAAGLAWLGTATAREIAMWSFFVDGIGLDAATADVLAARGRRFLDTLARSLRGDDLGLWPLLRLAVRHGLVERPDDDGWTRGMVQMIGGARRHAAGESVYRGLVEDAELLEHDVWQLFEVDCGTELSNAAVWVPRVEGSPTAGWDRSSNRWTEALLRLAEEGRLDRGRLLDASLDALTRDFRPSMVGWYAGFHEALAPTEDERTARVDRYLTLLTSPVPAVVNAGVAAVRPIEGALPGEALARAATTALTLPQKKAATDVLRLLGRAAERDPEGRAAVLEAVSQALGHERADVQEQALKLLERYPAEAPRGTLLGLAETVSATLRARVDALVGVTAVEPEVELAEVFVGAELGDWPEPRRPSPDEVRRDAVELTPVESVDELIELAAMLLEGQGDGDGAERFLDGVSRLCGERPPGFERRTAGLLRQAGEPAMWGFGHSGQGLIAAVVRAWAGRRRWRSVAVAAPTSVVGFLTHRAVGVAERAGRRYPRPLLALPTHSGGWIDPDVLAGRDAKTGRFRNRPEPVDRLQADLRTRPPAPITFLRVLETRKSQWGETSHSLSLRPRVPDGLGMLGPAIAALGTNTSAYWWHRTLWGGFDALGVRWSLTVLPGSPEIAFAGAAMAIADAELLGGGVQGRPEAVLDHALSPGVPLGPEAWLAVAAALTAKAPDLHRVGTDVLVASIADGRFDADAAGEAIAWLATAGVGKASRLAGPLRDAGSLSPLHGAQTVRLLGAVAARLEATPHGLQAVLETVLEHGTRTGYGVEAEAGRTGLERIAGEVSRGSKLGRSARALLDLPVNGPARSRALAAAAEAHARARAT